MTPSLHSAKPSLMMWQQIPGCLPYSTACGSLLDNMYDVMLWHTCHQMGKHGMCTNSAAAMITAA